MENILYILKKNEKCPKESEQQEGIRSTHHQITTNFILQFHLHMQTHQRNGIYINLYLYSKSSNFSIVSQTPP
jgi:hypothetical protein